jgi:hypothetical protein
MGFLLTRRTLGCKIESTPYTAETLTSADYDVSAYAINYDPDIQSYARKLSRGDFSRDTSIAGTRSIKITFSVDVAWSGTAATAPKYWKCLRGCGLKQTTHGATGVSLVTDAGYTNVPLTIEIVERDEGASPSQLVLKARGCMGNAKITAQGVGQPVKIDFEFTGVLVSIADRAYASIINPTGFDSTLPDAILAATTSLFSEAQAFNTITIDLGNKVEMWTDPSKPEGFEGAHIVDRNPVMDIDPAMTLIATNSNYNRLTGNTLGAMSMSIGNYITISAPKAQIIQAYKPGEREGRVVSQVKCELKRNLGNDELKILQGAE